LSTSQSSPFLLLRTGFPDAVMADGRSARIHALHGSKMFSGCFWPEWLALSWPELHLRASQTLIEGGWQINFLKRVIGQSCGVVLTAW
jgi:hypothetical protein